MVKGEAKEEKETECLKKLPTEEKPETKLESKIDWQIKQGSGLGFAGLGPRQVAGRAGQPGLGLAFLGWVLSRWQSGVGWQGQPGLGLALLGCGTLAGCAGGAAGAAGAWIGFAGLGPRQVAVRAGQVGLAGRLAWLGRLGRLGQSGQVGQAGAVRAGQAGQWGRQGQPGLGSALLGRWGRLQGHISSRVWKRIKDSTLNTVPILAILDDTALPGAKAEALDVESDGCCDDDDQIRPVQLLLRPAPYDESSGHWARTNDGGAADRLWEEIDQTLRVPEKLMLSGLKNHNGKAQMKGREFEAGDVNESDAAVDCGFEIRGELFLWIRGFEDDLWDDRGSGACDEDEIGCDEQLGPGQDGQSRAGQVGHARAARAWLGLAGLGLGQVGQDEAGLGLGRLGVGRGSQGSAWPCWAGSWDKKQVQSWISANQSKRKVLFSNYGVRYSILEELPYWDAAKMVNLDIMHNLILGDLKDHATYKLRIPESVWKQSYYKGITQNSSETTDSESDDEIISRNELRDLKKNANKRLDVQSSSMAGPSNTPKAIHHLSHSGIPTSVLTERYDDEDPDYLPLSDSDSDDSKINLDQIHEFQIGGARLELLREIISQTI
ncbi:hypothetical protein BY996DRAFT_6468802 [Phakopsora pachyrhizi]|nr:hypothetical protein BY996DRAFT_6468802 [Phakopsora pachyrhizi]